MKRAVILIIPAIAALAAGSAFAQAPGGQPPRQERGQFERQPPSPEVMARLQDGRFAMIKASLKLTDQQAKLWEPVEAQMRSAHAQRVKLMQERFAQRQQGGATQPSLTERLERRSAMEGLRAEQEKSYLAVLKPFYASLTEEQKQVADRVLSERGGRHGRFAGRGHGHGHGHRMGGDFGGPGMGGPGMGGRQL